MVVGEYSGGHSNQGGSGNREDRKQFRNTLQIAALMILL